MHNQLSFPYRTQSGEVEVRVSWRPGATEYEDLDVSIEGDTLAVTESDRARARAEAFLHVLRTDGINRGTELDGG